MSNPNFIDLKPYDIQRPEKLRWLFPKAEGEEDILSIIKSKSLRTFLRKSARLLQENEITVDIKSLTEQEFSNWLPYYRERMSEKEYDILANEEWFFSKIQEGYKIEGIFLTQFSRTIGSLILTSKQPEFITFNFKASNQDIKLSGGRAPLGAVLDYEFLKLAISRKINIISSGIARNETGVKNTLSYLDFKLSMGYYPTLIEENPLLDTVQINDEGWSIFYGLQNNLLQCFIIKKNYVDLDFPIKRFFNETNQIKEITIP